jgi:hypothetical protein
VRKKILLSRYSANFLIHLHLRGTSTHMSTAKHVRYSYIYARTVTPTRYNCTQQVALDAPTRCSCTKEVQLHLRGTAAPTRYSCTHEVHVSPTSTMVAVGLRKPYAKSESATNLVMYHVYLLTCYDDVVNGIKIPGIHFQYQNNA